MLPVCTAPGPHSSMEEFLHSIILKIERAFAKEKIPRFDLFNAIMSLATIKSLKSLFFIFFYLSAVFIYSIQLDTLKFIT